MELTRKQAEGLKIAIDRYRQGEKYTTIAGVAGVGKTVLISFIAQALCDEGVKPEEIVYCSYTGKAVQVLIEKGNKNACTLHKLLYESRPLPNGKFKHIPVTAIPYKVIVIDEISMCPKKMTDLLFSYPDIYVICCGDPAQLPPISSQDDNHILDNPHIFLDEIMRQALDSEIIRFSMMVREGKPLPLYQGKEMQILSKADLNMGMLTWADQVLVATNKTRQQINLTVREHLGFQDKYPVAGDKVICLRNYWEIMSTQEEPLINGSIGTVEKVSTNCISFPYWYNIPNNGVVFTKTLQMKSDLGGNFNNLDTDADMFLTGTPTIDSRVAYRLFRTKYHDMIPLEFAYGYAITTWKAQGSQFKKVLVLEENFPFDYDTHQRFIYTSLTRAIDKCVFIKA